MAIPKDRLWDPERADLNDEERAELTAINTAMRAKADHFEELAKRVRDVVNAERTCLFKVMIALEKHLEA